MNPDCTVLFVMSRGLSAAGYAYRELLMSHRGFIGEKKPGNHRQQGS